MLYQYNNQAGIRFQMKMIMDLLELLGYKEENIKISINKNVSEILNYDETQLGLTTIAKSDKPLAEFENEWYSYRLYDLYVVLYHRWNDIVRRHVIPDMMNDVVRTINDLRLTVSEGSRKDLQDKIQELKDSTTAMEHVVNDYIC
jgi:hypothetical protein